MTTDDAIIDAVEPRLYECCILYTYPLAQKDESHLLKEIDAVFQEANAKPVARDNWGRRGLAYPIKGATEASVIVLHFEMDPLKVKEVEHALKIMKGVLRFLMVKPPKGYQILKWSELYERWLKERESVEDKRARERQSQLEERVAAKAKRRAKVTTEKKPEKAAEKLSGEEMTEQIDKLISDDNLNI